MRIRVDVLEARRVADEVGQDKVVQRLDDGSVELALDVVVLRRHPILGPRPPRPRHRHRAARLPGRAGRLARSADRSGAGAPGPPPCAGVGRRGRGRRRGRGARCRPVPEHERRLRRLLAVIGWLAQVGEAPIAECGAAVRYEREGAGGRARVGGLLRHPALHAGHADGDRGVGEFGPGLPAGRVRASAPAHSGRRVRRGGVGAAAPGRAGIRGRRAAPRPGQARRCAGVPRGGGARRGRSGAPGRRTGGGGRWPGDRDRLSLRLTRRAHDADRGAGAGGDHRRPLVPRRVLPSGRRHAALPGRPDRCRPHPRPTRRTGVHADEVHGGDVRPRARCCRGAPGARAALRSGCPSPFPCAPWRGTRTGW